MSKSKNDKNYTRGDIYYCQCCGEFFHRRTHLRVYVPLTDMPADFALQVMIDRQNSVEGQRQAKGRQH